MNISIAAFGSRGDVQPYLALGSGLQSVGFKVQILTDPTFKPFIQQMGLGFSPVSVSPQKALQEDVRQIGSNPIRLRRYIERQYKPLARQAFKEINQALPEADALLFSTLGFAAAHVAEAYQIPAIGAYLQPITPTRYFSSAAMSPPPDWIPLKEFYNWHSHRFSTRLFSLTVMNTLNECRVDILDLPPKPRSYYSTIDISDDHQILHGFSRHVVPKPPDWGDWLHVVGYWFLDEPPGWHPPLELVEFLDGGPAPVYVGFGSMIDFDPQEVTQLVVDALQGAGQRGILLGGWSDLGRKPLPDSVYRVDNIPHAWLFPRMAAVVHHGGAGTTAAGLRAGVPTVTVPYFGDQYFWGNRVFSLGAGPRPIPRQKLDPDRLVDAIRKAVHDQQIKRSAAELGQKIRREQVVKNAVTLIQDYLGH